MESTTIFKFHPILHLLASYENGNLEISDTYQNNIVTSFGAAITAMAWSSEGLLAVALNSGSLAIWDKSNNKVLQDSGINVDSPIISLEFTSSEFGVCIVGITSTMLYVYRNAIISSLDKSVNLPFPHPTCLGLSDHAMSNCTKTEVVGIMAAVGYADNMLNFYFLPQIEDINKNPVKVDLSILHSKDIKGIYGISWCPYNDKGVEYVGMITNIGVIVAQISNVKTTELKIDNIVLLTEKQASYVEWNDLDCMMAICGNDSYCWRIYDRKGNLDVLAYNKPI